MEETEGLARCARLRLEPRGLSPLPRRHKKGSRAGALFVAETESSKHLAAEALPHP
jgi:hypothetical protein